MCEKCEEIDTKVQQYRFVIRHISDHQFIDRAKAMIDELESAKAALHSYVP